MGIWFPNLRNRSLATRGAVLAAVTVLFCALVGPVAFCVGGPAGLSASAAAGGICLLGAAIALTVCHVLRSPRTVLYGMLLGMAARMVIPLACGLTIHLWGGTLAEAGFLYYLLVFYPVTLAVETSLSLPQADRPEPCPDTTLSRDNFLPDGKRAATPVLQLSTPPRDIVSQQTRIVDD